MNSHLFFCRPATVFAAATIFPHASLFAAESQDTEIVDLAPVNVDATPFARTTDELAESITVLGGDNLDRHREASLGQTLDGQPGVTSTYFGPGGSRPIIRGLGGERIRVLNEGLGTIDVSAASPDHAVSAEPGFSDRVEILRGPAALLYGSSAVGGVVNIVDRHVPHEKPRTLLTGQFELSYGTGADDKTGRAEISGAVNNAVWQASFLRRQTGDVEIPGFAEHDHDEHEGEEEEEAEDHLPGILPHSAISTTSGSTGFSWLWDQGYAGAAVIFFDTSYGVPGHEHGEHEGEEEEEGGVQIELSQRRLDTRAEFSQPDGLIRNGRIRFGYADYTHRELEGGEIGTQFDTEGYEARMDLLHRPLGPVEGAVGLQIQHSTLAAEGEEAFLPPTRTSSRAAFFLEEYVTDCWRGQLGARVEHQDVAVRDGSQVSRDKTAYSLSTGAVISLSEIWKLAVSASRTERIPTAQEMFANGPHAATTSFEIGNPDLGKETSTGVEVSLRSVAGPVTGSLTLFANDFDRFIFANPTGAEDDHLPVFEYIATDARFRGAEWETTWHVHDTAQSAFHLTFVADTVRAKTRTTNEPLPRIPPFRAGISGDWRHQRWSLGAGFRRAWNQDRVAPGEEPSEGYTLISAYLEYAVPRKEGEILFFLRGSNLSNGEARPHTSFLKKVAPLPGRNVVAGVNWRF